MYLINRRTNQVEKELPERSFRELNFREREHLQQWIVGQPDLLGEDLLIIQEEFDGFSDTRERLDLLALDKDGNVVVIENKLDDTGRDATWQVLKYASYCSTLKKEQIRSIYQTYLNRRGQNEIAAELLSEFFDGQDYADLSLNQQQTQRIFMVAGNFRKEVTSTVLWLMNYKLRIKCFRASIYTLNEQILLDVEQVIPTPDTADYIISMADKAQEDISTQTEKRQIEKLRKEFWTIFLDRVRGKTPIYQNISPSHDHWLSSGKTGISGVNYSCIAAVTYVGIELNIGTPDKDENERLLHALLEYRSEVEEQFGAALQWLPRPKIKRSQILYRLDGVDIRERTDWEKMLSFLTDHIARFEEALRVPLQQVRRIVKETI